MSIFNSFIFLSRSSDPAELPVEKANVVTEVNCAAMAKGEVCFDSYYRSGDLGPPDTYGPDGPPVIELVSATYVLNPE